jgi:hypothetical protein
MKEWMCGRNKRLCFYQNEHVLDQKSLSPKTKGLWFVNLSFAWKKPERNLKGLEPNKIQNQRD